MTRRGFVRSVAAGGATLALGRATLRAQGRVAPPNAAAAQRALGEHRIARMETRQVQDRYPRFVGKNSHLGAVGWGGAYQVRKLVTDQGARGWGMNHWKDEDVNHLLNARVSDLYDMARGATEEGRALEVPLHDLVGNILGKPVYALLGSQGPTSVPIYSGAVYFDDLEPEDNPRGVQGVLASCQQDYELGYRAFKLKIGRGFKWMPKAEGIQRDIEVTLAVRQRFADCRILVDGNDGFTADEFITYLRGVRDCDLYWIEEPFTESREDYLKLREFMRTIDCEALIADGESRKDRATGPTEYGGYTEAFVDSLYALAAEKLVDVFLLDLGIVGYTRWRSIMPKLKAAGVLASPHTWMWTPRPIYAAHIGAGLGNVPIVEGIPGQAAGIDYSAFSFFNGELQMPETPGFGLGLEG
jgi:D-galactarolactone cycloisomerase